MFPKLGVEGQKKLSRGKVLIVGLGGLGGNIANSLVRAGVGMIRVVDKDVVSLSDLHRQVLFDEGDLGKNKAEVAYDKLRKVNSSIKIDAKVLGVNSENVEELVKDVALVIDGTDNLGTRFIINDACVKHSKPWVYGAVTGSTGMSMNILPGGPCLRCLIKASLVSTSMQGGRFGIFNTTPAVIAAYEATEAVKILLNDKHVCKELVYLDVWDKTFNKISVKKDKSCTCCVKKDFEWLKKD